MAEVTPEGIRSASFHSSFRGLDPDEVRRYLDSVAAQVEELTAERDRLAARLREFGDRNLAEEMAAVGRDVAEVLETARQAAESMRERAAADAARWRSEAMAETEEERRRARADAEQLRGDAWATAEDLLGQAQREAARMVEEAKEESLRRVGEAEREAHRIQAAARREAEDTVRNARMEAERLSAEAASRYDEIIQSAQREAESAQERTRALEQRRDELKQELDSVRAALATLEGELDERREQLGLSVQSENRPEVEEASGEEELGWTPGETVRVVRPHTPAPGESRDASRDVISDETPEDLGGPEIRIIPASELNHQDGEPEAEPPPEEPPPDQVDEGAPVADAPPEPEVGGEPEPEREPEPEPERQPEAEPEPEPEREPEAEPEPEPEPEPADQDRFDELAGLFARLRTPEERAADEATAQEAEEATEAEESPADELPAAAPPLEEVRPDPAPSGEDAFDLRERLLLPITNRALRSLKRQLTEAQNVALEELRLDDAGWTPEPETVRERLRADLVVLVSESFGAGHEAATQLTGERLTRPPTPKEEVADEFATPLVAELSRVLEEGRAAGQGGKQLSQGVSRVFRAWRTDEAERRVRDVAARCYHRGLVDSLEGRTDDLVWVVSGRGCATCRAAAEAPVDDLPPRHPGCGCTLTLA